MTQKDFLKKILSLIVYFTQPNKLKILLFHYAINIKIINEIFDILFIVLSLWNPVTYFTLTAHLNLDAKFLTIKVKCSPIKAIKLCLTETYFILLQFKIHNWN